MPHDVVLTFLLEEAQMRSELWTKLHNLYLEKKALDLAIAETLEALHE